MLIVTQNHLSKWLTLLRIKICDLLSISELYSKKPYLFPSKPIVIFWKLYPVVYIILKFEILLTFFFFTIRPFRTSNALNNFIDTYRYRIL